MSHLKKREVQSYMDSDKKMKMESDECGNVEMC